MKHDVLPPKIHIRSEIHPRLAFRAMAEGEQVTFPDGTVYRKHNHALRRIHPGVPQRPIVGEVQP